MGEESKHGLLRSSAGVALATFLSRILGLVRVALANRVLGGGTVAGAWYLAFSIPNLFRRLLGEGALGTALIPVITQTEAEKGLEIARRDLGLIFTVLGLILGGIVVLTAGIAKLLAAFAFTPWGKMIPVLASERCQLTLSLLPVLMPYAFFICLVGVVGAVLNTCRQFMLPALGALLLNFFMVGGLAWGCYRRISGAALLDFLQTLSLLVLLSGAVQLVLMLVVLWKYHHFPKFSWAMFQEKPVLFQLWHLVLPNIIAGAAVQVSFLVDRSLAMALGPQAVPALTNVDRLIDLPIGIFAISLGSVLMASMSRSAVSGNVDEMSEELIFCLRHVFFICVPAAVGTMFFWRPTLRLICLGGNYTSSDLEATAWVAIFYGMGIPFFCMLKVILPAFYARKIVKIPLYSSLISISANIVLNLILMWPLKQGGLALATVLSSVINNTILLAFLVHQGFRIDWNVLGKSLGKSLLAALIAGGAFYTFYPKLRQLVHFRCFGEFPAFMLLCIGFGIGYLVLAKLCRMPELQEAAAILRRRKRG